LRAKTSLYDEVPLDMDASFEYKPQKATGFDDILR
jgi:hypothetical protein